MSVANTLVVIDPAVADHQSLVESLLPGADVIILDQKRDGIEQISEALAQRNNISSLQIISHGESGSLQLGSTSLNLSNLDRYTENLKSWSNALSEEADILLYGCDVAAGEQGQAFIQQLSRLTGADIAASVDLTGSAAHGGDWQLEAIAGQIESSGALQPQAIQTYDTTLSILTVNTLADENNGYGVGRNSLREAIARANATPGTQTINIAVNGEINLARALPDIRSNIVLRGSGADRLSVRRSTDRQDFSIFTVTEGTSFTVSGLTIAGGRNLAGGGIINEGTVTAINCFFLSNVAVGTSGASGLLGSTGSTDFFTGRGETGGSGGAGGSGGDAGGGAIFNSGTLRLVGSTFHDNAAGGGSGGLGGIGGFGGNGASNIGGGTGGDGGTGGNGGTGGIGAGGAIFSTDGTIQIVNSTFSGNLARGGNGGTGGFGGNGGPGGFGDGDAIPARGGTGGRGGNGGQSGDSYGGAIFIDRGTMQISSSTLFDNEAEFGDRGSAGEGGRGGFIGVPGIPGQPSLIPGNVRGGGIFQNGGTIRVKNTIVAGNKISDIAGGADVSGSFTSLGNNLIGTNANSNGFVARGDRAGNNRNRIDPRLGPLLYNSNSIPTHALIPGSPAIDSGSNLGAPRTDGRNRPRRVDGNGDGREIVDIGAYEAPPIRRVAGTNANNRLATTLNRDIVNARGGNDLVFSTVANLGQGDFLDGGLGRDTLLLGGGTATTSALSIDLTSKQLRAANGSLARNFEIFNLNRYNAPVVLTGSRLSERILGGNSNDTINGGLGNDFVNGRFGNDSLIGSAGNDTLVGSTGNDTLNGGVGIDLASGGTGNDSYIVDSSRDRIVETSPNRREIDRVTSSTNYVLSTNLENLTLIGQAIGGAGNNLNNTITGNNRNNRLSGLTGNDSMSGGAGNDFLNGGNGNDTLDGEAGNDILLGGAGNDLLNSSFGNERIDGGIGIDTVSYSFLPKNEDNDNGVDVNLNTGISAGTDRLISIENIIGSNQNDTLTGNAGNNVLNGGNGDDLINGAGGNDILVSGIGIKRLNGGTGIDTASYSSFTDNHVINLVTGVGRFSNSNTGDRLTSIENVLGSSGSDVIIGNAVNNTLNGGNGRDRITGNGGNDILVGGLGNDTLTGGVGRDRFAYTSRNQGRDRITDFAPVFDTIAVSAVGFGGGLRRGLLAPTQFRLGARAADANDRFIYNRANGALFFDGDGTGRGFSQIAIATLNPGVILTSADILVN